MGPIALFDKSFLQSLSVDESVWFAHFFEPVVCPLFYVETLADLEKAVRAGRTPEQEVGIIATKFPESSGVPCVHHVTLGIGELMGQRVPMNGRIPIAGGRPVTRGGQRGVIFDQAPEAAAFSRWQDGQFLDVERGIAKQWREALAGIDLRSIAAHVRALGIDASSCRSLQEARTLAEQVVSDHTKRFDRIAMVMELLGVPRSLHEPIVERWKVFNYRPLKEYAPYVAHLLSVELFFQFALAAHQIGTEHASNRVDMAYLNYLPFCLMFVSNDDLHRRCAALFLTPKQEFVWGPDLKGDLARINQHFMEFSDSEKERGITTFARSPPKLDGSIVRALRGKFLRAGYDDEPRPTASRNAPSAEKLLAEMRAWDTAPTEDAPISEADEAELQMLRLERMVSKKRGSWWQLPKDLCEHDPPEEDSAP